MQTHRVVGGLPNETFYLKIGGVVFGKNENFPQRAKKIIKTRHFHNTCIYQTGT